MLPLFSDKLHTTELWILHTGAVSASVHIPAPLPITCKHGRKIEISIMGEVDFLPFLKCMSVKVVWPNTVKVHPITLLYVAANRQRFCFGTYPYTTFHDLSTSPKCGLFHELVFLRFFKIHAPESALPFYNELKQRKLFQLLRTGRASASAVLYTAISITC